jgi:hypothetical protein
MTSRRTKKLAINAPSDNDLVAKEKRTRKRSPRIAAIWTKTLHPNQKGSTKEKAEGGAGTGNPYKSTKKGAFHTFLGPPTAKA